jgi:hypothetical protein
MREGPTFEELVQFASQLPADQARALLSRTTPMPFAPEPDTQVSRPAPIYTSWQDYLRDTEPSQRLQWCRAKARTANRKRLMSGLPDRKITADEVWAVIDDAKGRCEHCGSLALEGRPSGADGRPNPWAPIGRRIGSLGHRLARFNGGSNDSANLGWSCLWCNTWPQERRHGATDHGAVQ